MPSTVAGVSLTYPKTFAKTLDFPKGHCVKMSLLNRARRRCTTRFGNGRIVHVRPVAAAPDQLRDKVEESIKKAKEACSNDPVSRECVAAWDEVEELSATASHARDRSKEQSDPLENYCKDNPETDECRTYDN